MIDSTIRKDKKKRRKNKMTTNGKATIGNIADAVAKMTADERDSVMLFLNGMIAMKSLMQKRAAEEMAKPQDERKEGRI